MWRESLVPVPSGLVVLLEDPGFVVVDKAPELLTSPGRAASDHDSVTERVAARYGTGLLVHRLDMPTSGLLIVALEPGAQRHLAMQFEARTVEKRYVAVLDGCVERDAGHIDLPLRLDVERRPYQVHDAVAGRPSLTDYVVVARGTDWTRVEFTPRTGRTHQLRVHAAHPLGLRCPIRGDRLYDDVHSSRADETTTRLHLHATFLAFDHPRTGERVTLESAPPF
ncbi:MAG: RluA family pseudouridine synthase [Myxococcales bacterium]|nr:RluA family pseudouridine synthase [Myxococcales bacterium]